MTVYGDSGIGIDLDSAVEAVDGADIFVLGFPFCEERLLIDLRPDEHSAPLVGMVEPVGNAQDRIEWLNSRRPGLTPPDSFLFFVWPHSTEYLDAAPILGTARERVRLEQGIDISDDLAQALVELRRLEAQHTLDAIGGGEGFETIWAQDAD